MSLGINPKLIWASLKGWPAYWGDLKEIKKELKGNSEFRISNLYPILRERHETNGNLKSHYFHEDLFVAQRVFLAQPVKHVDVGSRVDGFVAHVASFREIEVFDIRPQQVKVHNIRFITADFMNIPASYYNYADSLSSLNVIEHFGLGRYNDPIHVDGHKMGLDSMQKVLKPGGKFYLSTPMGPQRIEFNAHRVFGLGYLLSLLESHFTLDRFSYVDDQGNFHEHVTLTQENIANNCGCNLGFGIFEMTKSGS